MENCLMLNGKRIYTTEDTLDQIKKAVDLSDEVEVEDLKEFRLYLTKLLQN